MAKSILIVEDDNNIADLLRLYLEKEGYQATIAADGTQGIDLYRKLRPDLVLLDVMMPGVDGWGVLRAIRQDSQTPVIMLTAKGETTDKVSGLKQGADDYITKPFTLALVKMHIEAVLKRAGKMRTLLEYKDLQVDVNAQLIYYKEKVLETTRKEFDLMLYFMEHPGVVLPRNTILDAVWEYDYTGDVRTIDTLVKQLRKKLGDGGNYIRTVYGVGYIFGEDSHEK